MPKRKLDDGAEDDANNNESEPELFQLMYDAYTYLLADNDDKANENWEMARRRVKSCQTFHGVYEVEFKLDGFILPLHLAILHGAPHYLIKEIVKRYKDGCSVALGDGMMPLESACGYPKKGSREGVDYLRDDTDWENVILLLMKENPAAIDCTSENTALHLVLEHNPSLKLVQRMIELHQTSKTSSTSSRSMRAATNKKKKTRNKKKCLLKMKDVQGQLPLHVAVEHVASADVVLKIIQSYPEATRCRRQEHDKSLPLHCAVSFGCSGSVLTQIIRAFPDALSQKEQSGNTPLHLLFHMETNMKRWNIQGKSDDFDGHETLSEKAICQLLLQSIPETTRRSLLKIKNKSGHTISQAANECAMLFEVPDGLLELLNEAETGRLTSRKSAQSARVDIGLTTQNPFELSTDEGSHDSESDVSSDDSSD